MPYFQGAMTSHIKIGNRKIGPGEKCFVIAEVAQAHEGSLGQAHAFIDAAAAAGADAIKFQTHIAAAESTRDEQFRIPMSGQDKTRYDYWKRMEFTPEQWAALTVHAKEAGLIFLSSAFSVEAVELLKKIGMPAWKIGSGEFRSAELMAAMVKTKKPILLSTGMSRYDEVKDAVKTFQQAKAPFALLQCTSNYPTSLEDVGLNVIEEYRARYKCPVGLSDHSGTSYPSLAAMAQGANILELHVTFDHLSYGPDVPASVTFDELAFICDARDSFHVMARNPVDKDKMAIKMEKMRGLFTKSVALTSPQKKGTVISVKMLAPKKPGTGIPFTEKDKLVGLRLKRDVPSDRLLTWEDVDRARA